LKLSPIETVYGDVLLLLTHSLADLSFRQVPRSDLDLS